MDTIEYFTHDQEFHLESGNALPGFKMAYQTFGELNDAKDNVIWVIHALTANSNPIEWWPGIVGEDCPIDPSKYFIVCANALGSCYGSTCALDINPKTDEPFYHDFPLLTTRDLANSYDLLRSHLGLEQIKLLVGASMGGQQAMEWAVLNSKVFENLLLIATNAFHSPWGIAFSESQRMAIASDSSWGEKSPEAGQKGLAAARSIAMLSYRTSRGYDLTQEDKEEKYDGYRASSYQQYQGQKLAKRFNAFSYWAMTKALDSHDIGRGRGSREEALNSIKIETTIIGITTDLLFPFREQEYIHAHINNSKLIEIFSELGHDGFLTESKKVGEVISGVLAK